MRLCKIGWSMHEFGLIEWIRQRTPAAAGVDIGIGDDAAVCRLTAGRPLIATTDMLLEGSCFILAEAGPLRVGRKAMAVNLSDIAAMAGAPRFALVSLALPRDATASLAQDIMVGMQALASEYAVAIIGGDTNTWAGPLAISVTLLGEGHHTAPITRAGAKPGDAICVTGALGGSILGRHLEPCPRIAAAQYLASNYAITAMIDISDGLAKDLHRIIAASQCGALVDEQAIPIHADAVRLAAQTNKRPVDHALNDGEDFELIFTLPPAEAADLCARQPVPGVHIHCVGAITPSDYLLKRPTGTVALEPGGYEHRFR
jgi:thiamine-monophosphate kinase